MPRVKSSDAAAGPHGTAVILPPGASNVTADGRARARTTDRLQCTCGVPDFITTGISGVRLAGMGLFAAAVGSKTLHGHTITTGSLTVHVDGPWAGATLGFPTQWLATFNALASGRASGSTQQTYGNCGIESSRALLNASGSTVSEIDALNWALANTNTVNSPTPAQRGGSYPDGRQRVLAHYGVASHVEAPTSLNIGQAVAEGRGVITSHDAGILWGNRAYRGSGHAITVTGIEYDAQGWPKTVYTNDTGLGQGARPVGAADFFNSLWRTTPMNVSDRPLKP